MQVLSGGVANSTTVNYRCQMYVNGGDFSGDVIELSLWTHNVKDFTLIDLNPESNVANEGAFDNTTFNLTIGGESYGTLELGMTITGTGTGFDGKTLTFEDGKLKLGTVASIA